MLILHRYGGETDPTASNSLVSIVNVPSLILQRQNLEVLVSTLDISGHADGIDQFKEMALVPTTETPNASSESVSLVMYPVHRAIVVAEGLNGLMALGSYARGQTDGAVKLAVNLPSLDGSREENDHPEGVAVLNLNQAREALSKFRESTANAVAYEQGWHQSGMPSITEWFSPAPTIASTDLPVAVKQLINDLLASTSRNIISGNEAHLRALSIPAANAQFKQPLLDSLSTWATRAHTELRNELDAAFAGPQWARLAWWKMLWRIDDVPMITAEVLGRSWLVDAERGAVWLAGRATEAGFQTRPEDATLQPSFPASDDKLLPKTSSSGLQPHEQSQPPWPMLIPTMRHLLHSTSIPSLQGLGQTLLLQTVSVTTLSTALSALLYIAFYPTATLYSAGAIAALGLAYSLRCLQRQWEQGRVAWKTEVREAGREVLREVESRFRQTLDGGSTTAARRTRRSSRQA